MSQDPYTFDPALEELLHELARDPRSNLLRVQRPERPTRWTDSWDALSRWSPGLTLAEREILDVHRAEFATLLMRRWSDEIELRPPPRLFITKASTAKRPAPAPDLEALRLEAQRLRAERDPEPEHFHLAALLETTRPLSSEQMSSLVTTAVQLHPTSTARIRQGLDLIRTGQRRTAIGVLRRLLEVESRPEMRSYCWDNLALARGQDWNPAELVEWYRRACDVEDPRLSTLAGWLLLSVQAGDSVSAGLAAQVIDSLFDVADPRIEQHVRQQLNMRREGCWTPRPTSKILLEDLREDVGPTSRKVLHALE